MLNFLLLTHLKIRELVLINQIALSKKIYKKNVGFLLVEIKKSSFENNVS